MLLYGLRGTHPIMVYDYIPGNWVNILGCLLIMIPLLCIPIFVLVSLYKVSELASVWCISNGCDHVFLIALHFILRFLPHNQGADTMTTPSKDLRQARPHKPILTLCKNVIFKAQGQPRESVEERNEKMMMEEHSRVWWLLIVLTLHGCGTIWHKDCLINCTSLLPHKQIFNLT